MTTLSDIVTISLLAGKATIIALAIAGATSTKAQDFTSFDMTGWYDGVVAENNRMFDGMTNDMIWANMNDPYVQQAYYNALNSGQFNGSLQDFAYTWLLTGGMTDAGRAIANESIGIYNDHEVNLLGYPRY